MSKRSSNWYVPFDVLFLLLTFPSIVILSGILLPLLARFKSGHLTGVFYLALSVGAVGAVLLFFARLPLYRKRQFFAFGPRRLDAVHRKFYWAAYAFIAVSVLLLVLIWLRLR
jgi:hypothetical protein